MSLDIRTDDIIAICGKRRSGKSYFLKNFLIPKLPTAVVWDYNHEYVLKNAEIVYRLNDIASAILRGCRYVVFRPLNKTDEEFENFCYIMNHLSNTTIVVEEVERYETSWRITPYFKHLIDVGRHRGLGLVCTMRRTKRVALDVLFNADLIIAFKQHTPQDLDYLAEFMNPEVVYQLPKLPEFYFIVYNDREGSTKIYRKI